MVQVQNGGIISVYIKFINRFFKVASQLVVENYIVRIKRIFTIMCMLPDYYKFRRRFNGLSYSMIASESDPKVTRKFTRGYLSNCLSPRQKLSILDHHYKYSSENLSYDSFLSKLPGRVTLYEINASGASSSIDMCLPEKSVWEGDLCLEFIQRGALLYRMTFTFIPLQILGCGFGAGVFVGGSQSYGTAELRREASKVNNEINPATSLLVAIKAISNCLGITKIIGVKTVRHVDLAEYGGDKGLESYDHLWIKNHGVDREGFYEIPTIVSYQSSGEVLSNHASRTRRKRRDRQALFDNIYSKISPHITRIRGE